LLGTIGDTNMKALQNVVESGGCYYLACNVLVYIPFSYIRT